MSKPALILTASKGFGELIRQVLADAGELQPQQFSSPAKALEAAAKQPPDLVVIDTEIAPVAELVSKIKEAAPAAHIILIPAENKPDDVGLAELGADAVLSKPFYLPELVSAVETIYGPLARVEMPKASYGTAAAQMQTEQGPAHAAPEWLKDVSLSAQYLTQLSLESASQAALITRGGDVWAYAGELPQAAAEELANALAHDADGSDTDVARFVHLNATKADYMLYATALGEEYKLSLVFDAQMPFSKMRAQVDKLANALAAAPRAQVAVPQEVAQARRSVTARLEMPRRSSHALPTASPRHAAGR
jgi:DNA-binding NarL/FixJ family response regulator